MVSAAGVKAAGGLGLASATPRGLRCSLERRRVAPKVVRRTQVKATESSEEPGESRKVLKVSSQRSRFETLHS